MLADLTNGWPFFVESACRLIPCFVVIRLCVGQTEEGNAFSGLFLSTTVSEKKFSSSLWKRKFPGTLTRLELHANLNSKQYHDPLNPQVFCSSHQPIWQSLLTKAAGQQQSHIKQIGAPTKKGRGLLQMTNYSKFF